MSNDETLRRGPTFKMGPQYATNINNVAGDMTVHGGQYGQSSFTIVDAHRQLTQIRRYLDTVALPPPVRQSADRALAGAEDEISKPAPDKSKISALLQELTQVLAGSGALANAGVALVQPLQHLAAWLGPLAQSMLPLLAN